MVQVGVEGGISAVPPSLFSEIHPAGQFPHAEEVRAADQLFLEGAFVRQGFEGLDGPQVGVQAELLAHGEEALFGPHLRGRVIVIFGVADGTEKDGVALQADLVGAFGVGGAGRCDGAGSYGSESIDGLMAETRADGIHGLDGLGDHFRSDPVSGQFCDVQFHIILLFRKLLSCLSALAGSRCRPGRSSDSISCIPRWGNVRCDRWQGW